MTVGGLVLLAIITTFSVGIFVGIRRGISNEAWIGIGTAVYAFFTAFAFVVLLAAAWYAWRQVNLLRDQAQDARGRTRLDTLDRLFTQWESDLLREARRLANQSGSEHLKADLADYDSRNMKEFYAVSALANFIEEMGLLVREDLLDFNDVKSRFRPSIIYYGYLFSEYIDSGRENDKNHLVSFYNLAAAMAFDLLFENLTLFLHTRHGYT